MRHFIYLSLLATPALLSAQQAAPLPGYTAASSAAERALEAQAISRPDAARAREHSRILSAETHVAGTPAQERTRDYVIAQM
ncbi:MAG: peptidase, partial [Gemmatimonadetes bacterium]|nr:peptidase [Gemmatimonadota bacterium]